MPVKLAAGVAATALVLSVMPAFAHNAFSAQLDVNKPIRLEGTLSKMEWVNPPACIHIDVKKPDGSTERWMIEGGTPNTLFRRGVTKESLLPGTTIIVTGYQAKDGSLKGKGRDLTFADGRKLFLGSAGTGAPSEGNEP